MLKRFTLAALSASLLTAFAAQAQVTVDGVLNPSEGYHLIGTYDGGAGGANHSDPGLGLVALYATTTGTDMNIMVVGTPEDPTGSDYKAILVYLDVPGATGPALALHWLAALMVATQASILTQRLILLLIMASALHLHLSVVQITFITAVLTSKVELVLVLRTRMPIRHF